MSVSWDGIRCICSGISFWYLIMISLDTIWVSFCCCCCCFDFRVPLASSSYLHSSISTVIQKVTWNGTSCNIFTVELDLFSIQKDFGRFSVTLRDVIARDSLRLVSCVLTANSSSFLLSDLPLLLVYLSLHCLPTALRLTASS